MNAKRTLLYTGLLAAALASTFARRRTVVPRELPLALTRDFAELPGKAAQWAGFTRRLSPGAAPADLAFLIDAVAASPGQSSLSPVVERSSPRAGSQEGRGDEQAAVPVCERAGTSAARIEAAFHSALAR